MKNKICGFTLIESVVALFCLMLVVSLISLNLQLIKSGNDYFPRENSVAFMYIKLKDFLNDEDGFIVDEANSTSTKVVVKKVVNNPTQSDEQNSYKTYVVESYQAMVRVRGVTSGHMPLITGVKKVAFGNFTKSTFSVRLVENNGLRSELIFISN